MVKKIKLKQRLKITALREGAVVPEKATAGSAGYDLSACLDEPMVLEAGERGVVPTGIAIELPGEDYAALVLARSGLGIKHGITLSNGVGLIDSDYRGELFVGLSNFSHESFTIEPGDRIAQLVIIPLCNLPVERVDKLSETSRGDSGFGSSGKRPLGEQSEK